MHFKDKMFWNFFLESIPDELFSSAVAFYCTDCCFCCTSDVENHGNTHLFLCACFMCTPLGIEGVKFFCHVSFHLKKKEGKEKISCLLIMSTFIPGQGEGEG